MENIASEQSIDVQIGNVGQALRGMPAPSIVITLRMMVHLHKSEIRNRRKLSQSWDDICKVFVTLGYVKARPATITRYYYGTAPKKLPAVRAMILEMERNTRLAIEKSQQTKPVVIEQDSSSSNRKKPTTRGPVT